MADVSALADSRLRGLARRIDPATVAHMGDAELRVRCDTAAGLLDDIARSDDEYERARLKRDAEHVLNAVSLRAWIAGASVLSDAVNAARKDGAGNAVKSALGELDSWTKDHPQPGLSDPAVMAELTGTSDAVERPRRWFEVWKVR